MLVDLERKVVRLKVVYYGPARSGKTTNLERIAQKEGLDLLEIDTDDDRTLVFDFATKKVNLGNMWVSLALYTVPGQHIYKDIRLTVMRGVDGVIFVADSQTERLKENIEFLRLLKEDLMKVGRDHQSLPLVLQYNKMDLPNALDYKDLEEQINAEGFPSVQASAIRNEGVFETLSILEGKMVSKIKRMVG
ncbi:MAG: GTP-binding protein [Aquificaceae bacterium]